MSPGGSLGHDGAGREHALLFFIRRVDDLEIDGPLLSGVGRPGRSGWHRDDHNMSTVRLSNVQRTEQPKSAHSGSQQVT